MSGSDRKVELLETNKPRQERAKRTYEAILSSAAALLVEVGVERISTNLIAEKAGITVPALYRYFPNKYSVLHALGAVLMDRQNEVCQKWFDAHSQSSDPLQLLAGVGDLLRDTYTVTQDQPGGLEIIQSLRAVAPLQELRLTSHAIVAEQFAAAIAQVLASEVTDKLALAARVSVDMGYAIVEMALEDDRLPSDQIIEEGSDMLQRYWAGVLERP
jgi:AcrR family transcriptional regulator